MRTSASEARLCSLAILSIKNDVAKAIDFDIMSYYLGLPVIKFRN